jgi:hypothetical protein
MKKYIVLGVWTATQVVGIFEANSPEEAEKMAETSPSNYASLFHQERLELNEPSAMEFIVEELAG